MKLYIGNKNYSSWSMRPWVLLKAFNIPFEEVKLRFDFTPGSDFYKQLTAIDPGLKKVPVLVDDDGLAVWESMAIYEYVAERHPELAIWPRDRAARSRARTLCAEMHAGFGALRSRCPMNIEAYFPEIGAREVTDNEALRSDLARMEQIWTDALAKSGGPWLFGQEFSAADAYFAPVAMRVTRFALPMGARALAYVKALEQHPAVAEWVRDALEEKDFIVEDEPYRTQR